MTALSKIFSTCFGIGYFPLAPGTLTSFVIILLYKFFFYKLGWPYYLLILGVVFIAGTISSSHYSTKLERKDPGCIVIDEALGQMLALTNLSPSWPLLAANFLLFRFFDIIKPFPIRKIENFSKGWGIMLDDIVAAIYAGILIHAFLLLK